MIIYQDTNLLLSPAQTLVNTVNTVGVMGAGIAKEFKRYYPKMFVTYRKVCRAQLFEPGNCCSTKVNVAMAMSASGGC